VLIRVEIRVAQLRGPFLDRKDDLVTRSAALLVVLVALTPAVRGADAFDTYVNTILTKVPEAQGVQEIKQLTTDLILDNDRVLPNVTAGFVVVRTNEGRWSKLLVQTARQKIDAEKSVPILLIERFVTYKDGTDQTVLASGKNVYLFPGFRFNLDLGQVVPEQFGADLIFKAEGDKDSKAITEPQGKAKMYLLTKALPEAVPKKTTKLVVGDTFEARYFNGTFRLFDDGRRSGKLTLMVEDGNEIKGWYVSDKDGEKYEVYGKVGKPLHTMQFTIKFPRTEQSFTGFLFTGDGKVLTGSSRLQERESGFYAVRIEDE
jgi:hypothetical protein